MLRMRGGSVTRRLPLLSLGVAAAVVLLAGFLAAVPGPAVEAGGFRALHSAVGVAQVAAPSGYADLVAKVAPSIVTVRSERIVKPTAMPFGDDDEIPRTGNTSARVYVRGCSLGHFGEVPNSDPFTLSL